MAARAGMTFEGLMALYQGAYPEFDPSWWVKQVAGQSFFVIWSHPDCGWTPDRCP